MDIIAGFLRYHTFYKSGEAGDFQDKIHALREKQSLPATSIGKENLRLILCSSAGKSRSLSLTSFTSEGLGLSGMGMEKSKNVSYLTFQITSQFEHHPRLYKTVAALVGIVHPTSFLNSFSETKTYKNLLHVQSMNRTKTER